MLYVIEYIGREGVKTEHVSFRITTLRVGDPIELPNGRIARVDVLPDPSRANLGWPVEDSVNICCGDARVFLGWDEHRQRATVSIGGGGGPFAVVKRADLRPTYRRRQVSFWNWGDNSPGAGQGVEYMISRPVFKFVGESTNPAIMCSCAFDSLRFELVPDPECPMHKVSSDG